ncbi:nuclear valosin-containing protein-like isoform X1 [Acropora palmata]|uniref:nuclear valosin-containing protein-like isoform X1 n=1 Tax=Acropora palmata TaxID=6131 RepID=UPI003DA14B9D
MYAMVRDLGRKKQERGAGRNQLSRGAYCLDKRLAPRVKEYLNQFKKGHKPDVEEIVDHLQTTYSEYSRRKRKVFRTAVTKAYYAITKEKEEDKYLQEIEDKFLQRKRNSPGVREPNEDSSNETSDDEKDGDDKSVDSFSDSELSLGDEPVMVVQVQDTNWMNQSMQAMYKVTSLFSTPEIQGVDGLTSDKSTQDPKSEGAVQGKTIPESGSLPVADNQSTSLAVLDENQAMQSSNMSVSENSSKSSRQRVRSARSNKRKRNNIYNKDRTKTDVAESKKIRKQFKQDAKKTPSEVIDLEPPLSSVKFSDLGGCEETIEQVCKLLVHMKHPEVFRTLGITPPRGFLLHGPPGCGKTLLSHAIAGELGMPFIKLAATEIVSGVSGESEGKLRELFSRAVTHSPCVLFLDEIDAITPKRETASKDMERRIVSQLLTSMDDLNSDPEARVVVIGATNRPDSLDPALRRAGRFDREISMGIPDEKARERILRVQCEKLRLDEDFSFESLARLTPGFVGADLMSLTREAALIAVNRIFQELQRNSQNNCARVENTVQMEEGCNSSGDTKESSVINWLKEQSPLTQDELNTMHIKMDDFRAALVTVQPSAKREGFATIPDVTWDDVGALKDVREELTMAILAPVKYPEEFQTFGLTHPPGILLAGPPGCGKTLLAKAIANESGINFISVKGPELLNMYVGESERAIRQVFQRARNSAPCVIFFDELDALCPRRSDSSESSVSIRVVNQLLTEMDGLEARKQVFIMAATNRPDIIDPAMLRPGRLDKTLYVGLPNEEDREDILRTLTKNGKKPLLLSDVSIKELANDERCQGLSGADLSALVREASMAALRESISARSINHITVYNDLPKDQTPVGVGLRHFAAAFRKVKPSVNKKDQALYAKMKNLTAE